MSGDAEVVLLEGTFALHAKPIPKYLVKLTPSKLTYSLVESTEPNRRTVAIKLDDVVGCHCLRESQTSSTAYFCLYSYCLKKRVIGNKSIRKRNVFMFIVNDAETFDDNMKIASRWRLVVVNLLRGRIPLDKLKADSADDLCVELMPETHKLLVLVNPHSGNGKAHKIFQERVVPILAEADYHFHLVITEYAGHAREIVAKIDLAEWYGILIVSGDGLIYEVLNGLMSRLDWEQAIKIPIGCVPGGSGNALSCSIVYAANEENLLLHSMYILAKHKVMPMDIVAIDTVSSRIYSFLSITWGIIADIDIESEKYRYLGGARFTVGALKRILSLRTYRGRLSFLPVNEYKPKANIKRRTSSLHEAGDGSHQTGHTMTRTLSAPPETNLNVTKDSSDPNNFQFEDASFNLPECQSAGDLNLITSSISSNGTITTPSTPLLVPLDKPISELEPSQWVIVEDDFVTVSACYQTHLGVDLLIAPDSSFCDGHIHLFIVRGGVSRQQIVSVMTAMETGRHVDSPYIEMVQVQAFRLEPLTKGGNIMVDGELVEYGPIQAQILPSLARVMAK